MQPEDHLRDYELEVVHAMLHVDRNDLSKISLDQLSSRMKRQPMIYHVNGNCC